MMISMIFKNFDTMQSLFSELSTTYQPLMHHLCKKNYSDQIALFAEKRGSYAPLTPSPTTIIYKYIY